MCCCFNANVENQNSSCCLKISSVVSIGLAAVAALIAAVALVAIFVPPVGLFILGASFTTALATQICIGSSIAALILGAIGTTLCCVKGKSPVESLPAISEEDKTFLENHVQTFVNGFNEIKDVIGKDTRQIGVVTFHKQHQYPATVSFLQNHASYSFNLAGTISITYGSTNKELFVTADRQDYADFVKAKLIEKNLNDITIV